MIQVAMSADCAKHQQLGWHVMHVSAAVIFDDLGFCSGICHSVVDPQGVFILNTQEQGVAWMTALLVVTPDQKPVHHPSLEL